MKEKILIVGGDPNSINSEILCKMWKKINYKTKKRIYLITNYEMFKKQIKSLGFNINIKKVKNIFENSKNNEIQIINVDLNFKDPFNISHQENSLFIMNSLKLAHKLALNSKVKGLVNCSINKDLLKKTKTVGVTELLAKMNKIKKNTEVMLIYNKKFSVSPLTTHIKVDQITSRINKNLIKTKIESLSKSFKKLFNIIPKIAVLGLNPHNSELAKNSIEVKNIKPAILNLRKKRFKVYGPFAADTLFINDYKKFDIVLGMYHDQVLTPFKTIFKFDAINLTLGLKYIRVSPDHGTAINLIKKNKASPLSLIRCVELINKIN